MKFVDTREIRVKAGDGGSGMMSFKSARNLPKLGADGGDGGPGGSVYLVGDKSLNTLSSFYHKKLYVAEAGIKGSSNGKTGRAGEDLCLHVPLGTLATDLDSGEVKCEVIHHGQHYLVCTGGKRGFGNMRFLSSTHQAPYHSTEGGAGEACHLALELKVVADVGFAGLPNAGKSTLLSRLSNAKPKIADYPFTTLVPNLGVVDVSEETDDFGASYVIADIPGLIEGASEGVGLGHEFLRHLERSKCVAYVVDPHNDIESCPLDAFHMLRREIKAHSEKLFEKPAVIIVSKLDLGAPSAELREKLNGLGLPIIEVSSHNGTGMIRLKTELYRLVKRYENRIIVEKAAPGSRGSDEWSAPLEGYKFLTAPDRVNLGLGIGINQG